MTVSSMGIALDRFTTFGDLLKYLRRRAGYTQRELSIAVGYSDTQISRLEHNERLPDLATLTARFLPVLGLNKELQVTTPPTVINPISRQISDH
jgi:DNA-binding XRE family transcriptional regulator